MFADAYEISSKYTFPIIVSFRYFDGTVESGLGSFVLLNEEGWIVTAAHMLEIGLLAQQYANEVVSYTEEVGRINADGKLLQKAKVKKIKKLPTNQKWITDNVYVWGASENKIEAFHINPSNDIAVGKIVNFRPDQEQVYPVLRRPEELRQGSSLCKLGYPFYDIKATFNEETKEFNVDSSIFPIPRFPIEGIMTRGIDVNVRHEQTGKTELAQFIETSTPGLRGQSGGPIFDTQGRIWGIQSHTNSLPLGFSPKVKIGRKEVEENQFLNVGVGAHVGALIKMLDEHDIPYQVG